MKHYGKRLSMIFVAFISFALGLLVHHVERIDNFGMKFESHHNNNYIIIPNNSTNNNIHISDDDDDNDGSNLKIIDGRISTNTQNYNSIILHNICFDARKREVYVYTDHPSDMNYVKDKRAFTRSGRKTAYVRRNATDWYHDAKTWKYVSKKNVLFFIRGVTRDENPAHCLGDHLFTWFTNTSATTITPGSGGVRFDAYISLYDNELPCDPNIAWCCFLFTRAGIFDPTTAITQKYCFENFWVPRFSIARYAIDWDELRRLPLVTNREIIREDPRIPKYSFIDSQTFPLASLVEINRRVRAGIAPRVIDMNRRRKNVLVISRAGTNRRIWFNANEFVAALLHQRRWKSGVILGHVDFYESTWSIMSPEDQARVFARANVVISPHGAQLANLIFSASQQTVIVEVGCIPIQVSQKEDIEFARVASWFGSFTTRLGMKWLRHTESNQSCDMSPFANQDTGFNITPGLLLKYMNESGVFE
jgi:hypothetical protein